MTHKKHTAAPPTMHPEGGQIAWSFVDLYGREHEGVSANHATAKAEICEKAIAVMNLKRQATGLPDALKQLYALYGVGDVVAETRLMRVNSKHAGGHVDKCAKRRKENQRRKKHLKREKKMRGR